jgi:hypothetical protein
MMRRRRWLRTTLLLVATSAVGCHRGGVGARAEQDSWNGEMTVRVVNHSWLDVTVYLLQGTRRDRIGSATATSTTTFRISLRRLTSGGEYRLFGDPVGSRTTVRSEPLHAQDGDVVTWTLEDDLSRSTVDVR